MHHAWCLPYKSPTRRPPCSSKNASSYTFMSRHQRQAAPPPPELRRIDKKHHWSPLVPPPPHLALDGHPPEVATTGCLGTEKECAIATLSRRLPKLYELAGENSLTLLSVLNSSWPQTVGYRLSRAALQRAQPGWP
jgi:hypothetical protein